MSRAPLVIVGGTSLFRHGLCGFLQESSFELIGEYDDVETICSGTENARKAQLIIYISDGKPTASAKAVDTLVSCRDARVLVLSSELSLEELGACLCVGAGGYLLNNISREALNHSLRLILLGEIIFPSQLASSWARGQLWSNIGSGDRTNLPRPLTPRETEILVCLTEGLSNKMIARNLGITEATVKIHMKAVIQKVGVQNRTQAALWAIQAGYSRNSMGMAA